MLMFGCMGERDCESQGKQGPGIPLPGNLISDTRRIRIVIFVIISSPASYICTSLVQNVHYTCKLVSDRLAICRTLHYGIRWKLNRHSHQISIWFCIIPPEAPVWKDFTLTEYRHVWKNLYWAISWPRKVCLHMASFADAVEKSYANYGLVLPYINLHLRLQKLM